jgi:hypothetical protein
MRFSCGIYTVKTVLLPAKQAQWGGICIGLSIHHPGNRRGWVVSNTPWPLEPHEWELVPSVHLQHTLDIYAVTGFLIKCLYFRNGWILSTESNFKKTDVECSGSYFLFLWNHKVRNCGTVNIYTTRLRTYGLNGKLSKSMAQDMYWKPDKPLTKICNWNSVAPKNCLYILDFKLLPCSECCMLSSR